MPTPLVAVEAYFFVCGRRSRGIFVLMLGGGHATPALGSIIEAATHACIMQPFFIYHKSRS
jgi:hypothetical protein